MNFLILRFKLSFKKFSKIFKNIIMNHTTLCQLVFIKNNYVKFADYEENEIVGHNVPMVL